MERLARDVKVLWSNLYRNVRTIYISFHRPKDTFFSYRLLASLRRHLGRGEAEVRDVESKLFLRIYAGREVSVREAAHAPIPISINLLASMVSQAPSYSIAFIVSEGFKRPRLIASSLTVSKERLSRRIRPVLLVINPDTCVKRMKTYAWGTVTKLWESVEKYLAGYGVRYLPPRESEVLPPLAVVTVQAKRTGVEEIKAVISDGGEYREVIVPVRKPAWKLEDLPPKIIEDIKVSIVNPILKGLPFATKGAFLTGPPGVGKSVMAEALADALNLNIVELRPQTYRSMWYGATEKALNAIFREIIRRRRHIALIIDDAEFISSRKYTVHEAHVSEISTILYHLQRPDRPFTILTANNPDLIDPAILRPGRIDVTVVIGYPDREMRRKAVLRNAAKYSIRLEEGALEKIVEVTKWFTLAEVDALLRLAAGKGEGKVGVEEVEWARRKFNIDHGARASMQDHLRWFARKAQGIVITYIPNETQI